MRFTKKKDNLYYTNAKFSSGNVFLDNNGSYTNACIDKLGQLEDIEEELGIELILYFEIYKHCLKRKPIYYIKNNQIVKSSPRVECCLGSVAEYVGDYGADDYDFKDYGKTWALTREELL